MSLPNVRGGFLKYWAYPEHQPNYDFSAIENPVSKFADEIENAISEKVVKITEVCLAFEFEHRQVVWLLVICVR